MHKIYIFALGATTLFLVGCSSNNLNNLNSSPKDEKNNSQQVKTKNISSFENKAKQKNTNSQTEVSTNVNSQTSANDNNDNNDEKQNTLIYTNNKYGFTLELPMTWQGYKVSDPGNVGTLCFSLPSSEFCLFQLYVFDLKEHVTNSKNVLKLVGKTKNWQVITDKDTSSCTQLDTSACQRKKEVDSILKTFKAIN